MHELPVSQNLLEIALRHAQSAGASKVTALHLVIGDLSSFVDESLQFYWDILSDGTIAAGAKLEFKRIPLEMTCQACGLHFQPDELEFVCPSCHSVKMKVTGGDEFYLDAIDIEKDKAFATELEGVAP